MAKKSPPVKKGPTKKPFYGYVEFLHTGKSKEFHIGDFTNVKACIEFCRTQYKHALRVFIQDEIILDNTKAYKQNLQT